MMFDLKFDYVTCIANSEKIAWRLDDVMPRGTKLDFTKPFLPERLAMVEGIGFLAPEEKKLLNHITSNTYLHLFGFVEEYILAVISDHIAAEMFGDRDAIRALCRFADEEAKHMQLFDRYREAFNDGFGHECGVLESAVEVAEIIMQKSPIAVMLLTLHIELMTQQHFTECVKDNTEIDPFFASLLRYHWQEEAQHAKIDTLELEKLVVMASQPQIEAAFDDYLAMVQAFDGLLAQQAEMDLSSLVAVTGRRLSSEQVNELMASRMRSYRKTFLVYGMTNPGFVKIAKLMSQSGQHRISDTAVSYQ